MMDIGMMECDSFEEEDIDQLEANLQHIEGPLLNEVQIEQEVPITSFISADFVQSLIQTQGNDLKFIGQGLDTSFKAFFYILLLLGVEEKKHYPHLNTLIRQQFFKPNIFISNNSTQKQQHTSDQLTKTTMMLQKCLQYFQEIAEGIRPQEYIAREPLFQEACIIMLKNSVEQQSSADVFNQLCRKFNIDLMVRVAEDSRSCYVLGNTRKYIILREGSYYFAAIPDREEHNHSRLDGESIKSGESNSPFIAEVSQNSTPQFRNSEVKYRKKSHKNSFGGDMQIFQYRDLLNLHNQRLNKTKELQDYFDQSQLESCAQPKQETRGRLQKKASFQDIIEQNHKIEMKGSTTLGPTYMHADHRANRKISSSQIIEHGNNLFKKNIQEIEKEDDHNINHQIKNINHQIKNTNLMRTSLLQKHNQLQRIEEKISSQPESSHVDIESEPSDTFADEAVHGSLVKQKDRKYSYFTQQLASRSSKQHKNIESSNYVFKLPKNLHKNSEVITNKSPQHEQIMRRFHENPLRFSQLGSPSEESVQSNQYHHFTRDTNHKVKINSSVYNYEYISKPSEPTNWIKKQVIYYMPNGDKQTKIYERNQISTESIPQSLMKQSFSTLLSHNPKQQTNHDKNRPDSHLYNPYEINEQSFMKNRIYSMAHLGQIPQEQTNSIDLNHSRSLNNIKLEKNIINSKSPPVKFTYLQPQSKQYHYQSQTVLSPKKSTLAYFPTKKIEYRL